MPGYNLQTYKDRLLFWLEGGRFQRTSSLNKSDTLLFGALDSAFLKIQEELRLKMTRSVSLALTAGVNLYSLPENVMGRRVQGLKVKARDGLSWGEDLSRMSWPRFVSLYDVDQLNSSSGGTPVAWALNPNNPRQFYLGPAPDYGLASGVQLYYDAMAAPLHRIWNQSVITGSISSGGTALTASASVGSNVVAGDEIGFVPGTQTDGGAITGESPRRGYRVDSVSGTAITLSEAFGEAAVSGGRLLSAQVSEIEREQPGLLRWMPCEFAKAEYLASVDMGVAQQQLALAMALLSSLQADEDGEEVVRERPGFYTPFFQGAG